MSGFGNFVIAGSGAVGSHIARELLQLKNAGKINKVTMLTRSESRRIEERWGQKFTIVDYSSAESLKNAITGADFVISTLNRDPAALLQGQHLLAEQAKVAGVKPFVPSKFGDATDRENVEGVLAIKLSCPFTSS